MRILLTLCLLVPLVAVAQPIAPLHTLELHHGPAPDSYSEELLDVVALPDGGYVVVGGVQTLDADRKGWMLRLDANLETVWEQTWPEQGAGQFYSVDLTQDGLVVGASTDVIFDHNRVLFVDLEGQVLSSAGFFHSYSIFGPVEVKTLADGNVLVARQNAIGDDLFKISPSGAILWQEPLNQVGLRGTRAMIVLPGHDIITVGIRSMGFTHYYAVARVSGTGALEYQRAFDSEYTSSGTAGVLMDGGVVATGGNIDGRGAIIRTVDPGDGTLLQQRSMSWEDEGATVTSMHPAADGGLWIIGASEDGPASTYITRLDHDLGERWSWSSPQDDPHRYTSSILDDGRLVAVGSRGAASPTSGLMVVHQSEMSIILHPPYANAAAGPDQLRYRLSLDHPFSAPTPAYGRVTLTSPGGETRTLMQRAITLRPDRARVSRDFKHVLPANAPVGKYTVTVSIGDQVGKSVYSRAAIDFRKGDDGVVAVSE